MKRLAFILAVTVLGSFAQTYQTQQMFYSGSNVQYVCTASANVSATTWTRSAASLTSVAVSSNVGTVTTATAHNLWVGAWVTISGSTTAALNGSYAVVTVPSTTTFTIATSGVVDDTYNTAAMVLSTNSPLLNAAVWAVTVYHYDGSSNVDGVYPGGGPLSLNYRAKCSDRATY